MVFVSKNLPAKYYVNIQGDEPLMNPETIRSAVQLALKKKGIATAATDLKVEDKDNPSCVKVILGDKSQAIYFSRVMIPFQAHGVTDVSPTYKHLGIYVYPKNRLNQFVK